MQKRYCVDFRTKQMVPNRGELPMYYVENGHEAIITKELFVGVQKRLNQNSLGFSTTLPFSHKLFCTDCGGLFGPIPIHSTTYNDIVWKCSNRHLCVMQLFYDGTRLPWFYEFLWPTSLNPRCHYSMSDRLIHFWYNATSIIRALHRSFILE